MRASLRACTPSDPIADEACDLVSGQINFGLAYTREARSAYEGGNVEYGEVARKIAVHAYAAAIRFCANLLKDPPPALALQIEELEAALESLVLPAAPVRSIA